MKFLLDTNTVSYYMRGDEGVSKKIHQSNPDDIAISSVTVMELVFGAYKRDSKKITEMVNAFIEEVNVLPFKIEAARQAGIIRAQLSANGIALSFPDSQIAGQAKVLKRTLVTSDHDFDTIPKLKTICWRSRG
ncbi:MAG: type II toxin-antitoxin system VapC family toxin [Verrucomicrobiales bacterium]|nr:type II toxin-antitoxin system VapC family toxin [Verrucomicrobiales bacterium]